MPMDMKSLIHQPVEDPARIPTATAASAFPNGTSLPGLRSHFPSLPMHLPVFRQSPSSSTLSDMAVPVLGVASERRPTSLQSTTLAPLRFIIPSSHCASMNTYGSGSVDSTNSRSTPSLPIKVDTTSERHLPRNYSQVVTDGTDRTGHVEPHFKEEWLHTQRYSSNMLTVEDESKEHEPNSVSRSKVKKTSTNKRTRVLKATGRSTKSKARPGLRKGKWTEEESRYATQLTSYFKEGLLPIERGTMLRLYLSQKLNCEPMRITKKFTGGECIGKQVFRPCTPTPESRVRLMQAQLELVALEAAFIKKLKENREEAPGTMDDIDNESSSAVNNSKSMYSVQNKHNRKTDVSDDGSSEYDGNEDGFTSDSSSSSGSSRSTQAYDRHSASSTNKKSISSDEKGGSMDDAGAVGLLLDFFYKANKNEKGEDTATSKAATPIQPLKVEVKPSRNEGLKAADTSNTSCKMDAIVNSPTKRIRALSISSCVNDPNASKRSRVGSFTVCA